MTQKMIIPFSLPFIFLSIMPLSSFTAAQNLTLTLSISNPSTRGSQRTSMRDDYTYTEGVGAHKVHAQTATWNVARKTCDEEGGYLVVVNSIAEANVIVNLLHQTVPSWDASWIGFHDLFAEGEFVTVHSQSLAKAGFSRWASGEPSHVAGENCGGFHETGFLHDIGCDQSRPFVCELPALDCDSENVLRIISSRS